MLGLWPVPSSRLTVQRLWCLGLLGAFSCSVFPEEATLPGGSAATAGQTSAAGKGTAGSSVLPSGGSESAGTSGLLGGAPTEGGTATEGGAPPTDGGAPVGDGGMPSSGGAGGMPTCADPQERVLLVTEDTWIESAKPSTGHGSDHELSVVGGGQERRALLQVTLPAVLPGAVLLKATLVLHLQTNADVGLAERRLQVRLLEQAVDESRSTWNNWGNGSSRKWLVPGGDFGSVLATDNVPAGTATPLVSFNVTATVRQAFAAQPVGLPFIVMENGVPPDAPAELAFTSSEGDAAGVPALILQYCEP